MADADLIIAVCTGTNANVFYELGMAEAMGHEPILVAPDARHLPFDKAHCRCHMYGGKRLTTSNLRARLVTAIAETLAENAGWRDAPSPGRRLPNGRVILPARGRSARRPE